MVGRAGRGPGRSAARPLTDPPGQPNKQQTQLSESTYPILPVYREKMVCGRPVDAWVPVLMIPKVAHAPKPKAVHGQIMPSALFDLEQDSPRHSRNN